ncbi:sigma-54-dependent Fis family transcriptional regulator [Aggregicoccus sp. 17bor-14]|uniref:sigma-54-dependent transcriptional regulator n=1 Tax=Myxococcaceae TaxID=31 RepID=UPI00129D171A|nr:MULTISPECIES: sigma-54 dependent transcriptional regulator [Myxococcaceae]MBF5041611.1 sigma-54-dependent Fis family transcriptional regulator [Simulacricoccus sp. 17bor-14]MRI87396.1 sigma-54-dependent Fis family transcriptional regulator [Aggregicoccus sp. 17bor-14]
MSARILVVDDDAALRYTLREILESEGHRVAEAADGEEALARFAEEPFALVVTDLRMPRLDGMELLRRLQAQTPAPRVVLVTAHGSERQAVEAMKAGAYDYFRKPFETDELLAVVGRALETVRLAQENEQLSGELALARTLVFASEPMRRLALLVGRVAPRDVTVLISGESGTGKERVAEALVRASRRARAPYVRFNCAALTAELAEAELFGHAKGAFTGAVRARPGLFGEADGGTLLLDEVGELSPGLQGKLLRVLQEGEVRAVGEERSRRVDVRVLAATHRDLAEEVRAGRFREDLYYRLNVVHLRVPPLRERPEDIPALTQYFLSRFEERFGLAPVAPSPALLQRLSAYAWPGNVRELEHALESLLALSPDGELDLSLLPSAAVPAPGDGGAALTLKQRVDAYERGLVAQALRASGGNRTEAARALGVSRVTLHDKLKKYGLGGADEPEG